VIEVGTTALGATSAAAVALTTGDPAFGLGTTALGATGAWRRAGTEVANRLLGPREEARIGGVLALSFESLKTKLEQGRTLRDDGFFDPPPNGRPNAEEILEGVLRKAQTEYEERKLKHLSYLWANACLLNEEAGLSKPFGGPDLNYLVKLAEQLTYRQLIVLSMVGKMAIADYANVYGLREQGYEDAGLPMVGDTSNLLAEIMALHNLGCVRAIALLAPIQMVPSTIELGTYGTALHNLMDLWKISESERKQLAALLR
jgi:hypothetical protein